jgi:hypothetical protein
MRKFGEKMTDGMHIDNPLIWGETPLQTQILWLFPSYGAPSHVRA